MVIRPRLFAFQHPEQHHRLVARQDRFEGAFHVEPIRINAFQHNFLGQGRHAQGLNALLIHNRGHFHGHVVWNARQHAVVGHVHLKLALHIVDQAVHNGNVLLVRHLAAEQIDWPNFLIVSRGLHLLVFFGLARQHLIAPGGRVFSAMGIVPVFPRVQIRVVPPTAPARRVANGHEAIHLVLMNRRTRHLRGNRLALAGQFVPIRLAIFGDPPIQLGIHIFVFNDKIRQPNIVIQPRCLPRHLIRIQAQGARHARVPVMPVAQAAHLDAGLARHQGRSRKDRIARQQNPRIRAQGLHVFGDVEHELQVVVLGHPGFVIKITEFGRHFAPPLHEILVVRHGRRIDHKLGVFQRYGSIRRFFKRHIRAQVLGITSAEFVNHVEDFLVDVHKTNVAAIQRLGQAQILHQAQGKHHASRAKNRHLIRHCTLEKKQWMKQTTRSIYITCQKSPSDLDMIG